MDDTTSKLAVFLVMFWISLIILGSLFNQALTLDDDEIVYTSDNDGRGNMILKVMTFQITDKVPIILSIFLNAVIVFTIYVLYMIFHPLK